MSKQTINIGASPNDGTGTPLRTSFDYTNQNFTEIYTALGGGVALPGATTQVIFNDGGTNLAGDAGLVYNKTTDALTVAGLVTAGSATITGAATVGTTLGVTGNLSAAANSILGTGSKSTDTLLDFSADTGTQRIYLDRGGRNLIFKDVTTNIENYRITGVTGVQTWGVGGSTAMTLNSTGLGIGASPSYKLEVVAPAGDNIVSTFRSGDATAANNAGGGFRSISSATAASRVAQVWLDADGANFGGGDYFFIQKNGSSGTVEFNQFSNAAMTFLTNNTERARFNSTGALVFAGGTTTANGVGVTFPATQVASSDANTLDDYEEGTWTPTDASGAGLAFTVGSCRYTKVGRLVTIQGSVAYPSTASGANAIWSGFPFVAADNIFLTIAYTDTPIATFTYFSGVSNAVYLLTPGVNTINSSLSLKNIAFFGTYMV